MTYLPQGLPAPQIEDGALDAEYWKGAREGRLMVQRCCDCNTFQWGPEWLCHHCHSDRMTWTEAEPRGRIYSWQRVWHPVHPALKEAVPYLVVLVELPHAGGVRMVGNLLGDPLQDVAFDAEVEAVFEPHDAPQGPYSLVQWRVRDGARS